MYQTSDDVAVSARVYMVTSNLFPNEICKLIISNASSEHIVKAHRDVYSVGEECYEVARQTSGSSDDSTVSSSDPSPDSDCESEEEDADDNSDVVSRPRQQVYKVSTVFDVITLDTVKDARMMRSCLDKLSPESKGFYPASIRGRVQDLINSINRLIEVIDTDSSAEQAISDEPSDFLVSEDHLSAFDTAQVEAYQGDGDMFATAADGGQRFVATTRVLELFRIENDGGLDASTFPYFKEFLVFNKGYGLSLIHI